MRYVSLFLVLFTLSILKGRAQDSIENGFLSVQEVIAELFAQSDEEINLDESVDYLYQLASNPVKINKADEQEMKRIFWLSDFQVANLISYIKSNGQLQSAFEVAYIEGFTERDAKLLAPFLSFDIADSEKEFNFKEFTGYAKQKYILRIQKGLEEQAGFKPDEYKKTSFTGDPLKYYLRYHWYNDNISAGITGEKDSGEEFFTGSNSRGFDFYSYHLQVKNLKVVKNLILGDYKLNFGQGLVTGSAFSLGKMPSLLNSSYQNSGINRYTATGENEYFRGVACTFGYKYVEASVFYSNTSIDANISLRDSITGKTQAVSSLQTTGIHATSYEIADEDALKSYVYGSNIKVRANNAELGLTALFSTFNMPVSPVDQPYNVGYFRGKSNYAMGLNYRLRTGKILWFGESAMSKNKNLATINGFQTYVFSGLSLNVIYRNYERAYQSLYGNAFGENSRNQNESGFYFGLQCSPFKYTTLLGYADFFSFPALGYKVDMPSEGQEYLGQITLTPNAWFQMYVQYRFKQKETNETIGDAINNKIVPVKTQRCRLGLSYAVSQNIILKNRLEYTMYNKGVHSYSEGYLLSQDVNISLPNTPVKVYMRYALFETDTYDSRIYEYESDLLYSFSIPAFYDKGSRVYLMAKVSSSGNMDFWIKYSCTQYANKETISSGLYEIKGNRKSEIKMQVIINL